MEEGDEQLHFPFLPFRDVSGLMTPLPIGYRLAVWAVKLTILAAQLHLLAWLKQVLVARYPRMGRGLACAAALLAAGLVGSSELFDYERGLLGLGSPPNWLRYSATIWVAGCFGAYLMFGAGRGWRAIRNSAFRTTSSPHEPGDTLSTTGLTRRRVVAAAARTALAVPFAVAGYGTLIGRTRFDVREIDIKIKDLPSGLEGLRLAQLTDLHFGLNLSAAELETVVGLTNELRPHLTFVTGDLITKEGDPLEKCLDILSGLRADSGVWACMGNHEAYAGSVDFCESYARHVGIQFLRQQSELLRFGGAKLNLCGVDYQTQRKPYLREAGPLVRGEAFNLLLSHNPDVFPVAEGLGYDFTVSGHTHGGQVTVEILEQWVNPGHFFTPYVAGEYRLGRSALYVSRGIGTVNLAMRVGAWPEISLLTLRRA